MSYYLNESLIIDVCILVINDMCLLSVLRVNLCIAYSSSHLLPVHSL